MTNYTNSSSGPMIRVACEGRWSFSLLFGTLMTVGILLNAFILVVLVLVKLRSAFVHFLVILATLDMFVSMTGPSRVFAQCVFEWNLRLLDDKWCILYTFVSEFFVDTSNYMKVLLAIMQVTACFSSRRQQPSDVMWHFNVGTNIVILLCFAKNLAFSFSFRVSSMEPQDTVPFHLCTVADPRYDQLVWLIAGLFMWPIPYLIITICNVLLVVKLRRFSREIGALFDVASQRTAPPRSVCSDGHSGRQAVRTEVSSVANLSCKIIGGQNNCCPAPKPPPARLEVPGKSSAPRSNPWLVVTNIDGRSSEISCVSDLNDAQSRVSVSCKKPDADAGGFKALRNASVIRSIVGSNFIFLIHYLPIITFGFYAMSKDFFRNEFLSAYSETTKTLWQVAQLFRYLQHATECTWFILLCAALKSELRKRVRFTCFCKSCKKPKQHADST